MNISKVKFLLRQLLVQDSFRKIKKVDFVIVRHDNNCGYSYKGMRYAQIVDSVVDVGKKLGLSFVTITKPFSEFRGDYAYNSPLSFNRTFSLIIIFCGLVSILFGKSASSRIGCKLRTKVWLKLLESAAPKAVVAILPSPELCAAGKILGIKIYDYQHGVISKDQLWYGPELQRRTDKCVPHGILCWDDLSKSALDDIAKNRNIDLYVLGNPWVERFLFPSKSDHVVKYFSREKIGARSCKPRILVSLQWGLKDHYYKNSSFNGLLCDALIKVIQETNELYDWKLRLHPIQLQKDNKTRVFDCLYDIFGGDPGVEWQLASEIPLPLLLSDTDLHITDMSSVVIEAAWFGIPSAILNPLVREGERLERLFIYQRMSGIATVLNQNENEIKDWISGSLSNRSSVVIDHHRGSLESFLESHL